MLHTKRFPANQEFATSLTPDYLNYMKLEKSIVIQAIHNASLKHKKRGKIKRMLSNPGEYADKLIRWTESNPDFSKEYRQITKVNTNGKIRNINSPSLRLRVLQHFFIIMITPYYEKVDQHISYNCKKGYGLTSNDKSKSLLKRIQHLVYDRKDLHYILKIDQRKCYEHITRELFRKALSKLTTDKELIEFGVNVTFCGNIFPIGTPTSPLAHHIILANFDKFLRQLSTYQIRYADDCLLFFNTKEEAQRAKWRIKNYWWYVFHIRAKRHTQIIQPVNTISFCGLVFHRLNEKHCKGYITIRKNIKHKLKHCRDDKSYASYFGLFSKTNSFKTLKYIENKMKLKELTKKIKIKRNMDAKLVDIKDILGKKITITGYELRRDKDNNPNWFKLLFYINNEVEDNQAPAYCCKGMCEGIIKFLFKCEEEFEEFLPIEEVEIIDDCGIIFKGSTEKIKYLKVI